MEDDPKQPDIPANGSAGAERLREADATEADPSAPKGSRGAEAPPLMTPPPNGLT
jgi:hypothetical protein